MDSEINQGKVLNPEIYCEIDSGKFLRKIRNYGPKTETRQQGKKSN